MSDLDPRAILMRKALAMGPGGGPPQAPTLASIFGGPQPVAVSPATPAPVQPGVSIQPAPARPVLSLRTPPDAPDAAGFDPMKLFQTMQSDRLSQLADAEKNARIDPEQQALLDQESKDVDTTADDLAKLHAHSAWDNLTNMGLAMAQSNSPFFGQALAAGLQAATKGMTQDRYEQLRDKALLTQQRHQIGQARYAALKAAKDEARQKIIQGVDLAGNDIKLLGMSEDYMIKKATSKAAVDKALADARHATFEADNAPAEFRLKQALTSAQVTNLSANAAESRANAAYANRDKPGGSGGHDSYGRKDIDKATDDFQTAAAEADQATREWKAASSSKKAEAYAKAQAARQKALIAANAMRRAKGQAGMALGDLFHGARTRALAVPPTAAAAPAAVVDFGSLANGR